MRREFRQHLTSGERQVQRVFDFEHARYLRSERVHFRPELADQLCQDVGLAREWFRDKLVLDAGCGSGRWSYALASMGARVVAVDLTDSGVRTTRAALAAFPGCVVHQASIFELPYAPETFDLVLSWGVLHHTPDTHAAFLRLVPLVKPGGLAYVMVYERTAARHRLMTDLLRAVLRRLPDGARYRACRLLVIRSPRMYRAISPWLKVCDASAARTDLEVETLVFDTFDAYSPLYNHVHAQGEVRQWFFEEGFSDVVLTHPVRFTAPEAIARWGECGGAVHVRGQRSPSLLVSGGGAAEAASHLRGVGYVADDGVGAATWLDEVSRAPAPQLNSPSLVRRDAPEPVRWERVRRIADLWHGVEFECPAAWRVSREGRLLNLAAPLAQPPFQLSVFVAPARRDAGLKEDSLRVARRWLPLECESTLVGSRHLTLDGHSAIELTYQVTYGSASTQIRRVAARHGDMLIQLGGDAAWDASTATISVMFEALDQLRARTRLVPPRRSIAAFVHFAVVLAAGLSARLRRLSRVASRSRQAAPTSKGTAGASLSGSYDAHLDTDGLIAHDEAVLTDRSRTLTENYVLARASRPGPRDGVVPR